jgi:hypothetical protein
MATTLTVQTYNKYKVTDLEEEKLKLIRQYFTAVQTLKQSAQPPAPVPQPAPAQGAPGVVPPKPSVSPTSNAQV